MPFARNIICLVNALYREWYVPVVNRADKIHEWCQKVSRNFGCCCCCCCSCSLIDCQAHSCSHDWTLSRYGQSSEEHLHKTQIKIEPRNTKQPADYRSVETIESEKPKILFPSSVQCAHTLLLAERDCTNRYVLNPLTNIKHTMEISSFCPLTIFGFFVITFLLRFRRKKNNNNNTHTHTHPIDKLFHVCFIELWLVSWCFCLLLFYHWCVCVCLCVLWKKLPNHSFIISKMWLALLMCTCHSVRRLLSHCYESNKVFLIFFSSTVLSLYYTSLECSRWSRVHTFFGKSVGNSD